MSWKVSGRVWDLDIPQSEMIVLMSLAEHAEHDGSSVYPSIGLTAWKTQFSERQVQRILKKLVARGLLILELANNGGPRPNEYSINIEAGPFKPPYVKGKKRRGDMGDISRGDMGDMGDILNTRGDISDTPKVENDDLGCHKDVTRLSNQLLERSLEHPAIAGDSEESPFGEAPEATPSTTPNEPPSPHQTFIAQWTADFQTHFRSRYVFKGAQDGSAVSRMLKAGEQPADLLDLARRAWVELPQGFLHQQSTTIAGFASKLNEIRATLNRPTETTSRPTWAQIKELEERAKPIRVELEEWKQMFQNDAYKTPENIAKRNQLRETLADIDRQLEHLRAR